MTNERRISYGSAYSDGFDIRPEDDGREHALLGAVYAPETPEPAEFWLRVNGERSIAPSFVHRGHCVEIAAYPYGADSVIVWSSKEEADRWADDGGS